MDFFDGLDKDKRKLLTTFMIVLLLVPLTVYGGTKVFEYPGRCAICHSMKPEYYTWQASTHGKAKVVCLSCHSAPGIKNAAKRRLAGIKAIYSTATGTYKPPIKIFDTVKDSACERCHDMSQRQSQPEARDLNVPHQVHKAAGIFCSKCHAGIAHGNIANRQMTYTADYPKWTKMMGVTMMSNPEQIGVQMETCMRCHMLRKVTMKCNSCHPSGKEPASHKSPDFLNNTHGLMAEQELKQCDACHGYMSNKPVDIFKEKAVFKQYLKEETDKEEVSLLIPYSRANTFCRDCHAKRPERHKAADFITSHGDSAHKDKDGCMICHDNRAAAVGGRPAAANGETVTLVACGKCHPSSHSSHVQWRMGYHPYPLLEPLRITRSCYSCHTEAKCGRCHGVLK